MTVSRELPKPSWDFVWNEKEIDLRFGFCPDDDHCCDCIHGSEAQVSVVDFGALGGRQKTESRACPPGYFRSE